MSFIQYTRAAVICLPMLYMSSQAWAEDQWLLIAQGEAVNVGQALSFKVVKPGNVAGWPASMHIKLSGTGSSDEEIELTARENGEANQVSREYHGMPRQAFVGVVRAALVEQPSNTVLLLANNEPVIAIEGEENATQIAATENVAPQVVIAAPDDEPALTAEEPVYFLFGHGHEHGWDARFQISFKYRPFEPKGSVAQFAPFLSNLYFSYTQTTLWDIGSDSSPFRDTSYRPGLFYHLAGNTHGWLPSHWRIGVEHESNGQGGNDSRSLNTAYIRPSWQINFASGRKLILSPKIYTYLDKDENPDIQHYRGHADWQLRYGREDGLMLTGLYRQGTRGYATGQLDITYPLSDRILSRTGTFAHLQLFSGYGETLLDYDHKNTQIRLGISVTR